MERKRKVPINAFDVIGKRLGKLEVIDYLGNRYDMTKGGPRLRHYYICKCECGNIHTVQRNQILNEIIHSCGCARRKPKDR